MAFPPDVQLVTVTCGSGSDFFGEDATVTAEVVPILGGTLKRLTHKETGSFMVKTAREFKGEVGQPATFTVPNSSQAETWVDGQGNFFKDWVYQVLIVVRAGNGKTDRWTQSFRPEPGQTHIDLDLVPDGAVGGGVSAPAPPVTSVNGRAGAVVIPEAVPLTSELVAANLTEAAVAEKLPERLSETALSAAIGDSVAPLSLQVATLAGGVAASVKSSTVGRIIAIPETDPTPALNDGDMLVRYVVPGASFFTNFGGDTVGAAPAGWTSRWQPSPTWLVESDAGAAGGKVLVVAPAGASRFGLSWDAPTSDADAANFEILYRFKRTGNTTSPVTSFGRGSGSALAETAYRGGGRSTAFETVSKYVGGVYTMLGESAQTLTADVWYRARFRVYGSSLKLKVWLDSDTEPAAWTEGTDATISAKGWIGLVTTEAGKQVIDWVAVGTGGRTAVKP